MAGPARFLRVVPLLVLGLLAVAAVVTLRGGAEERTLTASFPRTVSIYEGSDVRVLGVRIGRVESVRPAGTVVEVEMSYDAGVKVPADAKAAIVAPSVVGDRFVQLTPVWTAGPRLRDGAVLDTDRTAVPLELDEIYRGIDDLAVGLGPDGANGEGALSRLLTSTARNVDGQGDQLHTTMADLSRFTTTLDGNKDALFDTVREVDRFVGALADNDRTVRDFNDSLAAASGVLEGERADLAAALRNLGTAVQQVSAFVKENRDSLSRNVAGLAEVTDVLVRQRDALDQTLTNAPAALTNLFHTYNLSTGTLDTRANVGENLSSLQSDPATVLCNLVTTADPSGDLCDSFVSLLGRSAPGGRVSGGRERGQRQARPVSRGTVVVERIDPTLAGIVEVDR